MADDDQMSRTALMDARERVTKQIRRLEYHPIMGPRPASKAALMNRLTDILAEIDLELGSDSAPDA